MASELSKKSANSGARGPRTVVLSPCVGNSGDNCGGAVAVSATSKDLSLASGSFMVNGQKQKSGDTPLLAPSSLQLRTLTQSPLPVGFGISHQAALQIGALDEGAP